MRFESSHFNLLDRPSVNASQKDTRRSRRGVQIDAIIQRIHDDQDLMDAHTSSSSSCSLELGTKIPKLNYKDTLVSNTTLNEDSILDSSYPTCSTNSGAFGERLEMKDMKSTFDTLDHWRKNHNPLSI